MSELEAKHAALNTQLRALPGAVVAFSGGVDSTLVLKLALDALGPGRVRAITGVSPSLPARELESCRAIAARVGADLETLPTSEMSDPRYTSNNPDRCYFCKTELYNKLSDRALALGSGWSVLNGVNADDARDHVHGIRAAREYGVRMPLAECGLTKADVRRLSRQLELPNWEKPALACLSSRVAYGMPVTIESLSKIEQAERFLQDRGFSGFRVRHHEGRIARIEVQLADLPRLCAEPLRGEISARLKELGYTYVTVDLQGFRSGSGNEVLPD